MIELLSPNLVIIDLNTRSEINPLNIGVYLLNKDTIPYLYISSTINKVNIEKVLTTRPQGIIVKPFNDINIRTTVALIINNHQHKKIDPIRNQIEPTNDIPFRIRNTINYIHENLHERIEIGKLASITKWKTHHFIRVFTKEVGITPYQYILEKKIALARAILEETDQPILEIGFDLGFQNYSNFCVAFKKKCDTTPENYRKAYRAKNYTATRIKF